MLDGQEFLPLEGQGVLYHTLGLSCSKCFENPPVHPSPIYDGWLLVVKLKNRINHVLISKKTQLGGKKRIPHLGSPPNVRWTRVPATYELRGVISCPWVDCGEYFKHPIVLSSHTLQSPLWLITGNEVID